MNHSEKNTYKIFRNKILDVQDRIDRIENQLGSGMPDVNFCADGTECWIEIKSPIEPKRPTTPLFGSNHKLSQEQKNWMLRQRYAKGKAYVLIHTDKRWMLISGVNADMINELNVSQLIKLSMWHSEHPVQGKEKWKALREVLVSSKRSR